MPESSLISILTPFKNTAEFLTECLESIQAQTYKNWELIAVNDHSTDESLRIVEDFAAGDARIKVFQNTGDGIIEALRLAFSKSKGTLVTRMDSDDIMKPDKLAILSNQLLTHGKGHVALGLVQYFSETGISNGYKRYEDWLNTLTSKGENYSEIYKECVIPSPCFMVHRDDLIAAGDFQPNDYPEDYDLTFRFYKHGLKCLPCDKLLHLWRDYEHRTSRTHVHYAQNYFLHIKLKYFLEIDYDISRPLVIWGAGSKGKTVAKMLVEKNIRFYWICDNPKKIGRDIYGQILYEFKFLETLDKPQSIITVANEHAQTEIRSYMVQNGGKPMVDYFSFC